jgi:carboxyl-terminal processing protease
MPGKPEQESPSGPVQKFSLDEEALGDYQLLRALDLLKGWKILKGLERPAA